MRTVTLGLAVSLDGFIAREDHSVDWLRWSNDVAAVSEEYWQTIDTVLMGRKSWEIAGKPYAGVQNYVFSRTLGDVPGVTVVRTDPAAFVRDLRAQPGKGICVIGGGELAQPLLEGGAVDELTLNVHPTLLGRGIPLFRPLGRQVDLELLECRAIQRECVLMRYRVLR